MNGRSDEDQLRFAAAQARCLVTRDYGDFETAAAALQAEGVAHAGVLLVPASIRWNDFVAVALAIRAWDAAHPDGVPPNFMGYLRNPRR